MTKENYLCFQASKAFSCVLVLTRLEFRFLSTTTCKLGWFEKTSTSNPNLLGLGSGLNPTPTRSRLYSNSNLRNRELRFSCSVPHYSVQLCQKVRAPQYMLKHHENICSPQVSFKEAVAQLKKLFDTFGNAPD